ncbi:MAG: magnesium transporter MgtE N-terminal domain-containing protein, partial [Gammaproteobacteria bacterium]
MGNNFLSLHFLHEHPRDAARTLEKFDIESLSAYLAQLPVREAAGVVRYLVPAIAASCLEIVTHEQAAAIITHLDIERAAALLRRMREDHREQVIKRTATVFANMIRLVLRYPDGTIGQVMDPDVFTVHQDLRVVEVTTAVRSAAELLQHEIYVINDRQQPAGVVAVKQLLTTDGMEMMKNIMRPVGQMLAARTSLAVARNTVDWDQRNSVPVVDHHGVFMGVLHRRSLNNSESDYNTTDEYAGTALAMAEM